MRSHVAGWLVAAALLGGLCAVQAPSALSPGISATDGAKWIWSAEGDGSKAAAANARRFFRREVVVPGGRKIKWARLTVAVDNSCVLYVNGKEVGRRSGWLGSASIDVARSLRPGKNVLAVSVHNVSGPAGLIARLAIELDKGPTIVVATDGKWKWASQGPPGWTGAAFDDSAWTGAKELGPPGIAPWGKLGGKTGQPAGRPAITYHWPDLPQTRPVTKADADSLLEADWLFQADDNPSPQRSLQEIAWARELAARLAAHPATPDFSTELAQLAELEGKLRTLDPAGADENASTTAKQLYFAVRRIKRRITFANPVLDFDRILLVDSPYPHSVHESAHRNGCWYRYGGSRLLVLEGLGPDGNVRDLLPGIDGFLWRPDLSFDARKVLLCLKRTDGPAFHLYEIDLDGSGLRQLTDSNHDDLDPIYLPDGRILFSTTRAHSYVRCLPTSPSFVLARCDGDGKNIRIISRNNEPDYLPSLLPDGRVVYTRWEYTERPLWRLQGLWTVNPDGTGTSVYWGNRSSHPDMLIEPRAIPGRDQVMFIGAGHHQFFDGSIGIVDVDRGREFPNGIAKVTPDVPWPETGDGGPNPVASPRYHVSGRYSAYKSPYPIGPEDFLVSARVGAAGRGESVEPDQAFSLYLMDIHGNRELVYRGNRNVWYAMPVRPRPKPPIRPDQVDWPKPGQPSAGGVLFSANVYEGVEGLPVGKAKYLRVIQMDAKTYSSMTKTWRHSGPAISVIQEDGVKRILGTVPIEADGSVHFKAPSGKALHFQLLDEHYRCLQVMRSFTGVMPGETRGCLGCHEQHSLSPERRSNAAALAREPRDLTPPPWGASVSISYERFCQPILDKYCGKCHQGKGKGRAKLDLTLRGGMHEKTITDPNLLPFKEPYLTLVGPAWTSPAKASQPGAGLAGCMNVELHKNYGPARPMTMLSYTSPLIERVMSGEHNGVRITGDDLRRLIAWVDCNCVYRGDEEVRLIPDPQTAGRFPVPPKIRTAPVIDRLQPIDPRE